MTRRFGVNVVGPLQAESGVGEASRALVRALDAAGVDVLPIDLPSESPSRQGDYLKLATATAPRFRWTLLCATAFETGPVLDALPAAFVAGTRIVGLWWWEVDTFPDFMAEAYSRVDAVWVGTEHVRRALAPSAGDVPLQRVRYPVRTPRPTGPEARRQLGLDPDAFTFVTAFGYYSSVVRKNPAGVIEAFRRAFAPGSGPQLVIKAIDHEAHPQEHAELERLVDGHDDITLLPGYLDREGMDDLLATADAVVSLHRAEGFGYSLAEAMAAGTPVIATNYSGNLEFMRESNSLLIPATMREIGEQGAPYPAEGQWAEPDLEAAATAMRRLASDPAASRELGRRAAADIARDFSPAAAGATMHSALMELGVSAGAAVPAWRARRRSRRLQATRG